MATKRMNVLVYSGMISSTSHLITYSCICFLRQWQYCRICPPLSVQSPAPAVPNLRSHHCHRQCDHQGALDRLMCVIGFPWWSRPWVLQDFERPRQPKDKPICGSRRPVSRPLCRWLLRQQKVRVRSWQEGNGSHWRSRAGFLSGDLPGLRFLGVRLS